MSVSVKKVSISREDALDSAAALRKNARECASHGIYSLAVADAKTAARIYRIVDCETLAVVCDDMAKMYEMRGEADLEA